MLVPLAIALHMLTSVIWVGGMFFAYMALRPVAADLLEPPLRLELWRRTFARFFPWVWVSVVALPLTGYWMIAQTWGNIAMVGLDLHLMHIIGWIMVFIFLYVYFKPYRRLCEALSQQDYKLGGKNLGQIRQAIAVNLTLGIIIVIIASAGRYM